MTTLYPHGTLYEVFVSDYFGMQQVIVKDGRVTRTSYLLRWLRGPSRAACARCGGEDRPRCTVAEWGELRCVLARGDVGPHQWEEP
jgi:hypothetical protein